MSPQLILKIVGIAALVVSALFALLAVHYYLTQNIRAVMDDLSGKARARGVAGTRSRANAERGSGQHRPAPAPAVKQGQVEPAAPASPAMGDLFSALPEEDDGGTMLVAAASSVPTGAQPQQPAQPAPQDVAPASFQLTRRVVLIHSREVIVANEEPRA